LYTGSTENDWFELELVGLFGTLCELSSGIAFLSSLQRKMLLPISAWTSGLFSMMKCLVRQESGCGLLLNVFQFGSANERGTVARYLFRDFPRLPFSSSAFCDLFHECVAANRSDFDVLKPLFEVKWLDNPQFAPLFAAVMLGVGDSMYIEIADAIIADLDFFCKDMQFVDLVRAVIVRGPQKARDAVFASALGLADEGVKRTQGKKESRRAMIDEANADQIDQLFAKLAQQCANGEPDESLFLEAMGIGSLKTRAIFVSQNWEALARLGTEKVKDQFSMLESELLLRRVP
jgi:hypothetical protein